MAGLVVLALLGCVLTAPVPGGFAQSKPGSPAPEVLYWRDSAGKPLRATGLLYRSEILSALVAGRPRTSIPPRVLQAIERQTPIVVMWSVAPGPSQVIPRPYTVVVRDTVTGTEAAPVWERQDATDIQLIDRRTFFQDVGTMAAFPRDAFRPGGIVIVTSAPLADDAATGAHHRAQVYGEFRESRVSRQ
jgi:hypothetical protein